MDVKFKQSVERVIPGWLSMIYKETNLLRQHFKSDSQVEKEGGYDEKVWDWEKEEFVSKSEQLLRAKSKILSEDKIKEWSKAMEELMQFYGSYYMPEKVQEAFKKWIDKKITESRFPSPYELLLDLNKFKPDEKDVLYNVVIRWKAGLSEDVISELENGSLEEGLLYIGNEKYADLMTKVAPLIQNLAGKDLFDRAEIQRQIDMGNVKLMEELGFVKREQDGSISFNNDMREAFRDRFTQVQREQLGHLKETGESETYKDARGKTQTRAEIGIDESRTNTDLIEDRQYEDLKYKNDFFFITEQILNERDAEKKKSLIAEMVLRFDRDLNGGEKDKIRNRSAAAGGFIPKYAAGGKVRSFAKLVS